MTLKLSITSDWFPKMFKLSSLLEKRKQETSKRNVTKRGPIPSYANFVFILPTNTNSLAPFSYSHASKLPSFVQKLHWGPIWSQRNRSPKWDSQVWIYCMHYSTFIICSIIGFQTPRIRISLEDTSLANLPLYNSTMLQLP